MTLSLEHIHCPLPELKIVDMTRELTVGITVENAHIRYRPNTITIIQVLHIGKYGETEKF